MSSTSTFDASDHGRRVEMLRMASDCEYALVVLGRVAAALAALETRSGPVLIELKLDPHDVPRMRL